MSGTAVPLKGWNVDALAASPDGALLVAGLSNFIGRHWTGAVAVLAAGEAGGAPVLRELKELRAGVPAIALLPDADQFTGGAQLQPLGQWACTCGMSCICRTLRPPASACAAHAAAPGRANSPIPCPALRPARGGQRR